jgi:hypothetical protein
LPTETPNLWYNLEEPTHQKEEIIMGAPSPELVNVWLAKAFNARDVEAATAMYHHDASVVRESAKGER